MPDTKLLIIDDETAQLKVLRVCFERRGFSVLTADRGAKGIALFRDNQPPVVITDLRLGDMSGLDVLREIKTISPATEVIIITAYGDVEVAVDAVRGGAADFILKPLDLENLVQAVRNAVQRSALHVPTSAAAVSAAETFAGTMIITRNERMNSLLETAALAAKTDATILIRGESGTGKELMARAIRDASARSTFPFVTVNCAALNENLLESELFGHRKGAFTGAVQDRAGRFEDAHCGTVFLDEIGDLPLATQVKLLRVLQEGEFQRVGDNETHTVDVRIITATNQDLEHMLITRTFREDLYYRLNVIPLWLPPLRERRDDIELLAKHFISFYAQRMNRPVPSLSSAASNQLQRYDFPGNVRELENIIQRSMVFCQGNVIDKVSIITHPSNSSAGAALSPSGDQGSEALQDMLDRIEKDALLRALDAAGGVQTKAAKMLGLTERQMRYRMKKLGL